MKKTTKKILASISVATLIFMCIPSFAANPGSSDDPLVSLSYVNDVLIPQLKSYVNSQIPSKGQLGANSYSTGNTFDVVNVPAGKTVIGAQGCNMILRMGKGAVVASAKGGLADVTAGGDLQTGTSAPANHLLIVPVDDWRGITMLTDGILMINGTYSIN